MLEVKDIKKKFIRIDEKRKKHEFYADNGITFQAKEGQIIGILGPNGAGENNPFTYDGRYIKSNEWINYI